MKILYCNSNINYHVKYFSTLFIQNFFYYLLFRNVNLRSLLNCGFEQSIRQENRRQAGEFPIFSIFLPVLNLHAKDLELNSYLMMHIMFVDYEDFLLATFLLPYIQIFFKVNIQLINIRMQWNKYLAQKVSLLFSLNVRKKFFTPSEFLIQFCFVSREPKVMLGICVS